MRIVTHISWGGNRPGAVGYEPIVKRAIDSGWREAKEDGEYRCRFKRGDPVTAAPVSDGIRFEIGGKHLPRPTPGEVIAVHPDGRWVMVAFRIGQYKVRECFRPWEVRPRTVDHDLDDVFDAFAEEAKPGTRQSGNEGGKDDA